MPINIIYKHFLATACSDGVAEPYWPVEATK